MRTLSALAGVAILTLSACADSSVGTASSASQDATAIDALIGKSLVGENATFIFNADGTVGGEFRGDPIVGIYKATSSEVCSTYTSPKQLSDREYCSRPAISGNTVEFKRRDGSTSPAYRIQG